MKSFILLVFFIILSFVNAKEEPPSAKPQNVKVEAIPNASLRVTWQALPKSDWNDVTVSYRIIYKELSSEPIWTPFVMADSSCAEENCSIEIRELKGLTEYSFVIFPFNSWGEGPMSDEATQFTSEGTPDSSPEMLMCEAISPTEIHVMWKNMPSESLHGTFKGYKVTYAPNYRLDNDGWEHQITMANETILHGLEKKTNYAFKLSSITAAGDGVQSEVFYCETKEDVPDEPVDVKVVVYGTEKVLVLWNPPLTKLPRPILHYTIYYRKLGSEAKTGKVKESKSSYEIFGLEADESYEFWVTATSNLGEGQTSEYVTAKISKETPAKIASLNDTVSVKFKENVTLLCDVAGSPTPNAIWKVNGDNLIPNDRLQILTNGSLIIQNITREDANNYTCIAQNAFGNDSVTHNLVVRAPPKSPEVTVLSTTTDEIAFTVELNDTGPDPIKALKLFFKLDSEIEDWQSMFIFSQPKKIVKLICGSSYLIFARGLNDLGYGDASEFLTVKTNGSKPIAPKISDFIEPSTNAVTLHFSSWNADSCPISHFFVEYKDKKNTRWIKVRTTLQPDKDFVLNLEPATLYDIRVTAHNVAGSTQAQYEVATLAKHAVV